MSNPTHKLEKSGSMHTTKYQAVSKNCMVNTHSFSNKENALGAPEWLSRVSQTPDLS